MQKIDWGNPNLDLDEILWEWYENLDTLEGFYTDWNRKRVSEITEFKWNSLEEIIDNLEQEKNIKIVINHKSKSLSLYDKSNEKLIWEISIAKYKDGNFLRDIHLYNVVEDEYKWQWWGEIMFDLYDAMTHDLEGFIMPEEEYTNVVSMINLYNKRWFTPKYKIVDWEDYYIELKWEDFILFEEIITEYKSGLQERKLPFTVVLEKEA